MFVLRADKNKLAVRQLELVTSGSVNVYTVRFEFSEDWAGMTRTAVFRAGGEARCVLLDEANTCAIPWEVLGEPNLFLFAGVYGTQGGEVVLPTVWASLGTILGGVTTGEVAQTPTPGIYEQILAAAQSAEETAQSVRADANAGVFNGPVGPQGGMGPEGKQGPPGANGLGAYELAVAGGLSATKEQFQAALGKMVSAFGDWRTGLSEAEQMDPETVYQRTRPVDWMALPSNEEIQDGEIWLLFQWPHGTTHTCKFSAQSASGVTVEVGRYADGGFTPNEAYTATYGKNDTVTLSLTGSDFGEATSTGDVQAMVRFRGELTGFAINSNMASCVDGAVKAPRLTTLKFDNGSNLRYINIVAMGDQPMSVSFSHNYYLRAIRGRGDWLNTISNGSYMFSACYALTALPNATFRALANGSYMFQGCYALAALPEATFGALTNGTCMFYGCCALKGLPEATFGALITGGGSSIAYGMFVNCYALTALPNATFGALINGGYMFQSCHALVALPVAIFGALTNGSYMFSACYALTALPNATFRAVTNGGYMFQSCYALAALPVAEFSALTNGAGMFYNCYALKGLPEATFGALITGGGSSIAYGMFINCYALTALPNATFGALANGSYMFQRCGFGRAALVQIFESLPVVTNAPTLTVTGNPGVSDLTDADKAIATGKGWRLVL